MTEINIEGKISGSNVNIGGIQHIKNLTVNNYFNIQPDEPQQISVFLSYARADDDPDYDDPAKSFIHRLYNVLIAAGFAVWWDRKSLPSRGETFTQEIETAIRACQRFVLVVGPSAIASPYVRAEWEFALLQCKPITPILRAGEYESIPEGTPYLVPKKSRKINWLPNERQWASYHSRHREVAPDYSWKSNAG